MPHSMEAMLEEQKPALLGAKASLDKDETPGPDDCFMPVEVHTHFMGVIPVERLVRYVEKEGFNRDPVKGDFGEKGASLIQKAASETQVSQSAFGLFFLLSIGLVHAYVRDKKSEAYYPLMVSLVAAMWMLHILGKHSSKRLTLPYLGSSLKYEDSEPPLRKGLIVKLECYKADLQDLPNIFELLFTRFPKTSKPNDETVVADLERVAGWALGAMLMASKCTPFGDSYAVRDIFAKYYGYEAYAKETLDFLVNEEKVRYAEQALGVGKLAGAFNSKDWDNWLKEFTDTWEAKHLDDERNHDGKKLIDIRWLITLPSSKYFQVGATAIPDGDLTPLKLANVTKDVAKKQSLAAAAAMMRERADVIGIDIAQPELPFYDFEKKADEDPSRKVAIENFKKLHKMVDDAARERGRKLVFRPHVGEGSGLKKEAKTYLEQLDEKNERTRFFYEVDNIFRANTDAMTNLKGTSREQGLEIFTMILMHLSPDHFRIAAGIADDTWWRTSSDEQATRYMKAFCEEGKPWPPGKAVLRAIEGFVKRWLEEGLPPTRGGKLRSAEEIKEFAETNMKILLQSLRELKDKAGKAWDPQTIVRFGHSTHATSAIVADMYHLKVRSEGNLGSNGRTGSIQFDWMTKTGDPSVRREEVKRGDYLDTWWNYNPHNLANHPLINSFLIDLNLILSTDGQGVENTRLSYEYAAAGKYYDLQAARKTGLEAFTKESFLRWLMESAMKHWNEVLEEDKKDKVKRT